jgi:hypothetical protein
MDIKAAVGMVELGTTADFRDGALFLQSACESSEKAVLAIRKGAFRALVTASSLLLTSKVMGPVEQLSILTMTTSQLLDRSSATLPSETSLVQEFIKALKKPAANPTLLLHFLTAMIHRTDVKEAAIKLKLYDDLADMYINKLPLLQPLADALMSQSQSSEDCESYSGLREGSSYSRDLSQSKLGRRRHGSGNEGVPLLRLGSLRDEGHVSPHGTGLTRATRRESDLSNYILKDTNSPLNGSSQTQTAVSELEHLSQALGESLVAQDLPSLIEHRRRQHKNTIICLVLLSQSKMRNGCFTKHPVWQISELTGFYQPIRLMLRKIRLPPHLISCPQILRI